MNNLPGIGPLYRRQFLWVIVILGIGLVAFAAWEALTAPRALGLLETFPALLQEVSKDEQRIGRIIFDNYREYRANARNWSFADYSCLFLSAACAAVAGLVIKSQILCQE